MYILKTIGRNGNRSCEGEINAKEGQNQVKRGCLRNFGVLRFSDENDTVQSTKIFPILANLSAGLEYTGRSEVSSVNKIRSESKFSAPKLNTRKQ